ncbi:MAG: NrfD/PsrC family molybdoenzyme membrane anchor subunit, partial [Tepidisphaeraceae bacterium]
YAVAYWIMITCNCLVPQFFWFKACRQCIWLAFILSLLVNVGMWLERFVIIVASLHRDFMPSSWGMYYPTFWDIATFAGTLGLFLCFFFIFVRFLPMISGSEMRELVHKTQHGDLPRGVAQEAEARHG